jgi:hypothetical protein
MEVTENIQGNEQNSFFFRNNQLELVEELVIYKPEISKYENHVSINGYYIISLCDLCDGWEVAEEDDIFKIPINIEVSDEIKYYTTFREEEKKTMTSDFEQNLDRKIKYHLFKNDSSIFRFTDQVKEEFYNILEE